MLFVSHRMPYPPNKGDKIRSYNLLRYVSRSHEVYLASHFDDPADSRYLPILSSMTKKMHCEPIQRTSKKLCSAFGLLQSIPISVSYFYSRKVQAWIDSLLDQVDVECIFCSSSPTAEYLFRSRHYDGKLKRVLKIMDLVDVDSYKWRQYAERSKGPMKWVYAKEGQYLQQYERRIADEFDHLLLVTQSENLLFKSFVPTTKSLAIMNGVDLEFFTPSFAPPPVNGCGPTLVFTGAMDYWPNIDAVDWFARDIFAKIRSVFPNALFRIVGSHPSPSVQRLAADCPGVEVTGWVDDIRPYIATADVCVIPLRVARGIQNKVLEAMAMGRPVVCTSQALEGIKATPGRDLLVADDADALSSAVLRLLRDAPASVRMARRARIFVETEYSWESNLQPLRAMMQQA